jgi:hypothetical protein
MLLRCVVDAHAEVAPSELSALETVMIETKKEIEVCVCAVLCCVVMCDAHGPATCVQRLENLQLHLFETNPDSPKLLFIDEKLVRAVCVCVCWRDIKVLVFRTSWTSTRSSRAQPHC